MKRGITLITITLIVVLATALLPGLADSSPSTVRADARAQSGITWTAQYFNNEYLQDAPVLTRTEASASLNWGGGSPGNGVSNDHFSARLATDAWFDAGTYRFFILADDGVKLWIDFPPDQRPTINTYDTPAAGTTLSADVTLSGGWHHIQVDFREITGDAYLYVNWANAATNPGGPNFPAPAPVTSAYWAVQYYNNPTLSGAPVVSQTKSSPTHNWGYDAPASGVPADNFSARWSTLQTLSSGSYTFSVVADDGVRVVVDGVTVINEFHGATGQIYNATVNLTAGQHSIVIEYYDATLVAMLNYTLTQGSAPPAQPQQPQQPQQPNITGATAVVKVSYLNLRASPSAVAKIIGVIHRGEQYQILGRNASSTWWQLNVNGKIGWSNGRYLTLYNTENVPVTSNTSTQVIPTATPFTSGNQCPNFVALRLVVGGRGMILPGNANNLRSEPSSGSTWVGQIPASGVFDVLGGPVCGENGAWWQVRYGGVTGWTLEGQFGTYWVAPY